MADPFFKFIAYRTIRFSFLVVYKVWNRVRFEGRDRVPRRGACILACNHASHLDPPLVACAVPHRIMYFMARDTLFDDSIVGKGLRMIRTIIPINRESGDVGAIRKGLSALRQGHPLALFPEGTRTSDGNLQPVKGGLGLLIVKAGVPVVPVYVHGTFEAFPRGAKRWKPTPLRVLFGEPIAPAEFERFGKSRASYQAISDLVMGRIAALRPSSGP
jgi:1-acyl-sn-glycerol-3-phosphate acyltransferase